MLSNDWLISLFKKNIGRKERKREYRSFNSEHFEKPLHMVAHFRIMKVSSNKTGYILGKYTE